MSRLKKYLYMRRFLWPQWMILLSWIAIIVNCERPIDHSEDLQRVLDEAGKNKVELLKVLTHYSTEMGDSLKFMAASFLIENMYKHEMILDSAYQKYTSRIMERTMPISTPDLNKLWDSSYKVEKRKVAETIKAVDLIADIDEAFAIREQSRWKDSIDWEVFLSHILPYKVDEEMFVVNWRTTLYNRYKHLLDNVSSPKEAFVQVKTLIRSQSREAKSNFSKNMDPLTMDYLRRGSCAQLDIYTIAVLRALHIPAAYDFIENWGNYSKVGHSWPSYVETVDVTYTLAENDSILRRFNPIDASYFKEHAEPDDYPLHVKQHKTVYKVYRRHYALQKKQAVRDGLIKSNHREDVSPQYGLHGKIESDVSADIAYASLSIFRTGFGWAEIAYANKQDDKILFSGLGRNVMYLITCYDSLGLKHVGDPFYLSTNTKAIHFPADGQTETFTLYRKYPLFGNWVAQWQRMLGGLVELGLDTGFSASERIYRITTVPSGKIVIPVKNVKNYSTIRYVCPPNSRTPIAEMTLYNRSGEILNIGKPIGHKLPSDKLELAFDGNILTNPPTKEEQFWLGLDCTNESAFNEVSKIEIIPKNDGNFIKTGDKYTLFYFDKRWIKVYQEEATADSLVVQDVPLNAIYWLQNNTKGVEERIFTMQEGRQVWW